MKHAFAVLAPSLPGLPAMLRSAFRHPWVASFQIGFGPPFVKSSPALEADVREASGVLEKLDIYFRHCVLDEAQRQRLAARHRLLVVRRLGPVEAEALDASNADVLDLRLRLRRRDEPPASFDADAWSEIAPPDPTVDHEGRFLFRLDDPRGERMLHHSAVAEAASGLESAVALELGVAPATAAAWRAWLADWARVSGNVWVELGRPLSHARRVEDGEAL